MTTSPPEERTVYWTVAVHETSGSVHRSTGLYSASAVRHQYGFWAPRPSTARIELTEHTLIQTGSVTTFEDLPSEGEATPLPDLPVGAHEVKRFFKFTRAHKDGSLTGFGPAVLPTGDDVRYFYNWTISTQDTALAKHVEVSTLRILDITLTHYTREISRALLPDAVSAALLARLTRKAWRRSLLRPARVPTSSSRSQTTRRSSPAAPPPAETTSASCTPPSITAAGSPSGTVPTAAASSTTPTAGASPTPRTPPPWRPPSSSTPANTAAGTSAGTPRSSPTATSLPRTPDPFRRPGAATPGRRSHRPDSRKRHPCCGTRPFPHRSNWPVSKRPWGPSRSLISSVAAAAALAVWRRQGSACASG